jgi:transposase
MVLDTFERDGNRFGVITRIARELGIGDQSLRTWVAQAEIDGGQRAGVTTDERKRLAELEKENRELRRFSSRPSSTVDRRSSRVHRRPPGSRLRWAAMGGRADLRDAAGRPFHLLRRQGPAAVGARGA